MVFNKPVTELTKEDIDVLIENEVQESKMLDYKRDLPTENKEFAADVAAFANAAGGFIIFGIPEKEDAAGKRTGMPASADGIAKFNEDEVIRRLEGIVRTNIDPKIPTLQWKAIPGFPRGPILVLYIPRSWSAPHMLTAGESRFPSRNDRNKVWLDVREIRSAFLLSAEMPTLIRRFRDERLGRIMADETPVMLDGRTRVVLHVIPFSSMSMDATMDLKPWEKNLPYPMGGGGVSNFRYNFDGFLTWKSISDKLQYSYLQVFRSGALETVSVIYTGRVQDGQFEFYPNQVEEKITGVLPDYISRYQRLGIEAPIVILVSLLNVKGATFKNQNEWFRGHRPIDREVLLLPDVILQEYPDDVKSTLRGILRPTFDALWQACGVAESPATPW
ncbi:hypothetical protein predicted by Glimmer/Critica [Sorangium cellulosum So ce56]|uniref:Schlafen AlbA-2 domain-containing protein n=1 Tax=Sorangium cellulosum (strain So ce56) TaxID=448385 RepID=A9GPQ9_SORC5|nr:RNA-binding domain-containing protein [Sorangium cellulosum]CAN96793.1 hypothetical protein predicted by Glimmer/Critica [Sorangium cellulosum So ce56]